MPAPSNIERWFSQLGSLTQTPLVGSQRAMKSAPTLSPPLEPTDWIVATRAEAIASWTSPNNSFCTSLRKFAAPSIGR